MHTDVSDIAKSMFFYVNNNKNIDLALMNKLQWLQRKSQLICEVCGIPAGPQMQNNSI